MNIQGTRAIVTGASGGIGRAVCAMLLDAGAARVGMLSRDGVHLRAACDELAARVGPSRVVALPADVRDPTQVGAAMAQFTADESRLHVLVNAAGILRDGPVYAVSFRGVSRYPAEKWDDTLAVNLSGAYHASQAALPHMVSAKGTPPEQSKGVIVHVSSISRRGRAGQAAYSASKAGLVAFSVSLAQELAPFRVRSLVVAPGLVATPMAEQIPEAFRQEMLAQTAAKRMGRPEEIAHGVRFCIENEFFNARVLELDGGAF